MHYPAIHFKIRQVTRKLGQTAILNTAGTYAKEPVDWMCEVASCAVLEAAFDWLCKRRVDYADSADVWECALPLARDQTPALARSARRPVSYLSRGGFTIAGIGLPNFSKPMATLGRMSSS
jgi:hypothetical protein